MPETTVMGLGLGMGIKMGVDGRFYASMGGVTMPSQVTNQAMMMMDLPPGVIQQQDYNTASAAHNNNAAAMSPIKESLLTQKRLQPEM